MKEREKGREKSVEQGEDIERIKQSNTVLQQTIQNLQEQINEYRAHRWQEQIDALSSKLEASESALRDQILQQSETIEKLRGIVSPNSFSTIILQEPKFAAVESFGGNVPSESLDDSAGPVRARLSNAIVFKGGIKLDGIYIMVSVYNDWSVRAYSRNHNQFFKVIGFPPSLAKEACVHFLRSLGWFDLNGEYVLKSGGEGEGAESLVVEEAEAIGDGGSEVEIKALEGSQELLAEGAPVLEGQDQDRTTGIVGAYDTIEGSSDASARLAVTTASSAGEAARMDVSSTLEATGDTSLLTTGGGEGPAVFTSDAMISTESVQESNTVESVPIIDAASPLVDPSAGPTADGTSASAASENTSATLPAEST